MNAKTKTLLLVFAVLLAVVVLIRVWPEKGAGPGLNIAGWSQGHKVDKAEEKGPFDKVEVTIKGKKATFTRDPSKKDQWSLTPPEGARADRFKLRQVIETFREDLTSVLSSKVDGKDLASFGLDDDNVVRVALFKGGEKAYDVEIGTVQKPEKGQQGEGDTFVRLPGGDRAYRIVGRDLRRPFASGMKGLRDRRVFAWESKDVTAITVENPSAKYPVDQRIELVSEENKEKDKRAWHFKTPDRFKAGDVKSYAGSIASMYAQEFVEKVPEGVDFGGGACRIEVTLADGNKAAFSVSAVHDGSAYVKVDGAKDYAKVSKYTGESLRKTVADLRDKTVFGVSREEILKVRITDKGRVLALTRAGDGFRALVPAGMPLGGTQVDSLLRDIETLKARDLLAAADVKGKNTGLGRPSSVVKVTTMDGRSVTLKVGREKESGTFYASVSGSDDVMTLAKWSLGKVLKGPADMRNKKVFAFEADHMSAIEIAHGDQTLKLAKTKTEGDGKGVWKATAPEAADLDKDKVRTMVNTLAGLSAKELRPGKKASKVGLSAKKEAFSVTVTLDDGTAHSIRVSAEKDGGDPYAVTSSEPDFRGMVFTLNQYQVKNFEKRLAELK